jgi:AcrR family transcriptional regulator
VIALRKRMTADGRRDLIEAAATELFARLGYRGASIDEIARQSGVTPPVVYDHFASKQDLYLRLIERHYAALRQIWFEQVTGDSPLAERLPLAIDAWFAYVEAHPFAGRMLFWDTTGDPAIAGLHRRIQDSSRGQLLPLVAKEAPGVDAVSVELAWETMRAVLQGLAQWWHEHPEVTREKVVAAAMNAIWLGFERVFAGEVWSGYLPG